MAVRAKMRVTRLQQFTQGGHDAGLAGVNVSLQPVYPSNDQDTANKEWSKWTPSGEVNLCITNPDAFKQFELGKVYFVDFNLAE